MCGSSGSVSSKIIWEPQESGIIGIHPPIISVIGTRSESVRSKGNNRDLPQIILNKFRMEVKRKMETLLSSETKTVTIDTDGPFTITGEKINPTGRKKLAAQLKERNFGYVRDLVLKQVEHGVDILDVNVGVPGEEEVVLLSDV